MNSIARFFSLALLCTLAPVALAADVRAHGTGHSLLFDAKVVAVKFHYSDQTPMRYAEVLVFSPQDLKVEHQNGRTDKNGTFVFCPDGQGTWLIKVKDGMGHAAQATVDVVANIAGESEIPGPQPANSPEPLFKAMKIIAGLSLILNLALAAYLIKQRANSAPKRL